jgi:hypothetical protein
MSSASGVDGGFDADLDLRLTVRPGPRLGLRLRRQRNEILLF